MRSVGYGLTPGHSHMPLQPQALVHCRSAVGAVPALAFLCDSERLARLPLCRPRPRLPGAGGRREAAAAVRPSVLTGMAQTQYKIYSKQSCRPDTLQARLENDRITPASFWAGGASFLLPSCTTLAAPHPVSILSLSSSVFSLTLYFHSPPPR